jgi:hypothetical protein
LYAVNTVRVRGSFAGKRFKPQADGLAQGFDLESPMYIRKEFQFGYSSREQGLGAAAVLALVVVECRRDLNQALEKCLIRSGRR